MMIKIDKTNLYNEILPRVEKPITYQGNEIGAIHKKTTDRTIRFAFAFPDLYEIGMSHLGMKILYGLLNREEDIWCERAFAPAADMEELLLQNQIPLFSLESATPLSDFDFIGFTLQYEMSYSNVLHMLSLGNIPLLTRERGEDAPLVIAGGPCAYNPEPLADFVDLFVIGEGEEVTLELMDVYRQNRDVGGDKAGFLRLAAGIEGVYVPSFYQARYYEDGRISTFEPTNAQAPPQIRKRFIKDIDNAYFPENLVIPFTETVHDRISMEIFRGCGRGCRFCQAGTIYRPVREKKPEGIISQIKTLVKNTGYDEVSLMSLSSGDYGHIEDLIDALVTDDCTQKVAVSLPSLRIDSVSIEMLEKIQKVRKTGITLAPEAGTQRLRDVINKGVTEEDLLSTTRLAFARGWRHIKLYFIIGLPTETDDDILGIADLAQKVLNEYLSIPKDERNKTVKIVVSTSCFIPKPHTPFQWMGQPDRNEFVRKQKLLKSAITDRRITYNWHDDATSYLEAVFARGDRKLGETLLEAHRLGARFDGWREHFDEAIWEKAFENTNVDLDFYAKRNRSFDEMLPWDFINTGVSKAFLKREWEKAQSASYTSFCKESCAGCGFMTFEKGWYCDEHFEV